MTARTKIQFAVERITPAKAEEYLLFNTKNRKLSRRRVSELANTIKRGEWALNGECIKFAGSKKKVLLVDGQHRLEAIVQAGQPVEMCVIRGLEPDAFQTVDAGKPRTPGDCLYVLDYKNPNALAAAGRQLRNYEIVADTTRVSNAQLLDTIDRHPKLVERSDEYMRAPLFTRLIPHSLGILGYYLASCVDVQAARQFFTELASDGFSVQRTPAIVLRDRLEETSLEIIKPTTTVKRAWLFTAWNAHVNGRQLRRLSRLPNGVPRLDPDPFPRKAA